MLNKLLEALPKNRVLHGVSNWLQTVVVDPNTLYLDPDPDGDICPNLDPDPRLFSHIANFEKSSKYRYFFTNSFFENHFFKLCKNNGT